jgi:hypothetical protein
MYQVNNVETTQLFNLNEDPWEISNLAQYPEYANKLQEMTDLLDRSMRKYDDPMNLNLKYWGKEEIIIPDR